MHCNIQLSLIYPHNLRRSLMTYIVKSSLTVGASIVTALEPRCAFGVIPHVEIVEICTTRKSASASTSTSGSGSSRVLVDSGRTFSTVERWRGVHQHNGYEEDGGAEEAHR
ncbi:hypothetical protein BV25DRAFT_1467593 [Artomyces pyxidatus]|uniref:Uncharacterized protein n=1 Tax=Artomyces pyxidatus TaxID=48021 RepID=A0ACB8SLF9_9AGAM|nr:hypothetical protein BV25DRAFT_1467593 [Artomyces pyxidatus]